MANGSVFHCCFEDCRAAIAGDEQSITSKPKIAMRHCGIKMRINV
jgi:hypothetical protein